jgi:hypothetical protein
MAGLVTSVSSAVCCICRKRAGLGCGKGGVKAGSAAAATLVFRASMRALASAANAHAGKRAMWSWKAASVPIDSALFQ